MSRLAPTDRLSTDCETDSQCPVCVASDEACDHLLVAFDYGDDDQAGSLVITGGSLARPLGPLWTKFRQTVNLFLAKKAAIGLNWPPRLKKLASNMRDVANMTSFIMESRALGYYLEMASHDADKGVIGTYRNGPRFRQLWSAKPDTAGKVARLLANDERMLKA